MFKTMLKKETILFVTISYYISRLYKLHYKIKATEIDKKNCTLTKCKLCTGHYGGTLRKSNHGTSSSKRSTLTFCR